MRESRPTGVLFVCLGNICRSPAAEGCFLHLLAREGLGEAFQVDSAGTGNWHVGQPPDPRMRAAAARRGISLPSQARQIVPADLDRFDHILVMDQSNLAAVRQLASARPSRATIALMTHYCQRHRGEEVPDPYYGGPEGFDQVLDLLETACEGLLEHLRR
ncbi:MAG: low molecular weight protein-tyrosine-phosphatase [Cyanobacteriota bacterium]|jgi:protein-tyrosine phosphatase